MQLITTNYVEHRRIIEWRAINDQKGQRSVWLKVHSGRLTCARSTAPSVEGRSLIPSLRVASLASRPSTALCAAWVASRLENAGKGQKSLHMLLYQGINVFALGFKHRMRYHKGAVRWFGIPHPSLCMCADVLHAVRGMHMFDGIFLKKKRAPNSFLDNFIRSNSNADDNRASVFHSLILLKQKKTPSLRLSAAFSVNYQVI